MAHCRGELIKAQTEVKGCVVLPEKQFAARSTVVWQILTSLQHLVRFQVRLCFLSSLVGPNPRCAPTSCVLA